MNGKQLGRLASLLVGASLLAITMAVPAAAAPSGGTSRSLSVVGAGGPNDLGSFAVSAAETIPFSIVITNTGKQTLNDVTLLYGRDDNPLPASNGDATPPTALPAGITVATTTARCTGGSTLTCAIGTLRAGQGVTINATIVTTRETAAAAFLTEVVVSVAEGDGDAGSNVDTFSAQGDLAIDAFSCEATIAYRPGSSNKEVSTCALTDGEEGNGQSSKVRLPARLSTVALRETAAGCPAALGTSCLGRTVEAAITGDASSDVIVWTMQIALGGVSVNANRVSIYHTDDGGSAVTFPLTKQNACPSAGSVNCGKATISGDVLTVVFQTAGNGSSRTYRS